MKAFFGSTQLAGLDADLFDHAHDVRQDRGGIVEEVPIVRGTVPARFDRKNFTRGMSFRVLTRYASHGAVVLATKQLLATLNKLDTLKLLDMGDVEADRIENAELHMEAEYTGCVAIRTYTGRGVPVV